MKIAFIDLQGFKDDANNFVPKQAAAILVDGNQVIAEQYVTVAQVLAFSTLSEKTQRINSWVTRNHLHQQWGMDGVSLLTARNTLWELCKSCDYIMVMGLEKAEWTTTLLSTDHDRVVNMQSLDCPSLKMLKKSFNIVDEENDRCLAKTNVRLIMRWYFENKTSS